VFAPHEPGAVEQPDAHGGEEQQHDDRLGFSALADRGPERASHEREPDAEPGEQEDLPEAAEVDVFPALVSEPEVVRQA
jgi:hypothetical protein